MHGLILLTAMSATGGLFGGGKCARPAHSGRGHHVQNVSVGGGCGTAVPYATAPVAYAPAPVSYAPTPQSASYPAPAAMVSYQSFYSVGSTCATGNCPRR